MAINGELRVWWIPQVPMSPAEARKLLNVLADYDIVQFENRIKPDYCNTGGVEVFTDGEWSESEDADCDTIYDAKLQEAPDAR